LFIGIDNITTNRSEEMCNGSKDWNRILYIVPEKEYLEEERVEYIRLS